MLTLQSGGSEPEPPPPPRELGSGGNCATPGGEGGRGADCCLIAFLAEGGEEAGGEGGTRERELFRPGPGGGLLPQNPLPPKKSSGGCSSRTRSPQIPRGPSLAQVGARPAWFCCRERGWGMARGPPSFQPGARRLQQPEKNAKRSPRSSSPPPQEPVPITQCHAMVTATGLLGSARRCPGNSFPLCFPPGGPPQVDKPPKRARRDSGTAPSCTDWGFSAAALAAQHQRCLVPTRGSLRTHNKTSAAIHMTGRKRTHTDARLQETSFAHSGVPRCERKPKHSWGEEERRIYLNEHTLLRSCLRFPSPPRQAVCISPLPTTN